MGNILKSGIAIQYPLPSLSYFDPSNENWIDLMSELSAKIAIPSDVYLFISL